MAKKKKNKEQKRFIIVNEKVTFIIMTAVIALTIGILYGGTTEYKYVFCDDNIFCLDFYQFNKEASNIPVAFEQTVGVSYYRPFLIFSFMMDAQRGGIDPVYYRTTNIILHILGSILVLAFFLRLGYERITSFLFSMLFAVHPIIAPSATWISGRNDSLLAVLLLSSFLCYSYFRDGTPQKWLYYGGHIILFFIALFTKEIAAMFPLILLAETLLVRNGKFITKDNIILASGYAVAGLIWHLMRMAAITAANNPDDFGLEPFFINLPTIPAMLGKMLLPVNMIALSTFEMFSIITGFVVLAALIGGSFFIKEADKSRILFGTIWFTLLLVPSFFIRLDRVEDFFDYAEHRAFLPMIGILIIVLELLKGIKIDFKKSSTIGVIAVIVLAFAIRSYAYTNAFKDRTTFWQHMVDLYPYKARGYLDLGKAYFEKKEYKTAEKLYQKGLEINPDNPSFYIDLSALNLAMSQFALAEKFAKQALEITQEDAVAWYNLSKSYIGRQMLDQSLEPLHKAAQLKKHPTWFFELAQVYYTREQYDKAEAIYEEVREFDPNSPILLANLGSVYVVTGREKKAVEYWNKALSLNSRFQEAYINMIRYYIGQKDADSILRIIRTMQANNVLLPQNLANELRQIGLNW